MGLLQGLSVNETCWVCSVTMAGECFPALMIERWVHPISRGERVCVCVGVKRIEHLKTFIWEQQ